MYIEDRYRDRETSDFITFVMIANPDIFVGLFLELVSKSKRKD